MRRILVGALVAGVMVVGAPAAIARPQTQSTTCNLDANAKFNPGLLFSARNQVVSVTGTLSGCVGGGVTGGTVKGKGSGSMSCTSGSAAGTLTITWNTTERSKASVVVSTSGVTGSITSGKFKGESVSGSLTVTGHNGDCLFTPITRATLSGSVSV